MRVSFKKIMFAMLIGFASYTLFSCNAEPSSNDNQFIEDLQSYQITLKANDIEKSYSTLAPSKNPPTVDLNEKLKDFSSLDELKNYSFEGFYTDINYSDKFEKTNYTFSTDKLQDTIYLKFVNEDNFVYEAHDFSQWTSIEEPTLTTVGYIQRKCKTCPAYEKKKIPALSSYVYTKKDIQKATCLNYGQREYTYKIDNQTFTFSRYLPKLEHNFVGGENVLPTFEKSGKIASTCLYCGLSIDKELPALNDEDYATYTWQVNTCSSTGVTYYVYTNDTETTDDDIEIVTETPILEHEFITRYKIPTCVKAGYSYQYCKNCGLIQNTKKITLDEYNQQVINDTTGMFGHTIDEKTQVCSLCNKSFKQLTETLIEEKDFILIKTMELTNVNYTFKYSPGTKASCDCGRYVEAHSRIVNNWLNVKNHFGTCDYVSNCSIPTSSFVTFKRSTYDYNDSKYHYIYFRYSENIFQRTFTFKLIDYANQQYTMTIAFEDNKENSINTSFSHDDHMQGEPYYNFSGSYGAKAKVIIKNSKNEKIYDNLIGSTENILSTLDGSFKGEGKNGKYHDYTVIKNTNSNTDEKFYFNLDLEGNCGKSSFNRENCSLSLNFILNTTNNSVIGFSKSFSYFTDDCTSNVDINYCDISCETPESLAEKEHFNITFKK